LELGLRKAAEDAQAAKQEEHHAQMVALRARLNSEFKDAEKEWRCRGFRILSLLLAWRRLAAWRKTAEAAEVQKLEALQQQQQHCRAQISEIERFLGDREISDLRQRMTEMSRELEALRQSNSQLRAAAVQACGASGGSPCSNCFSMAETPSPMAQRLAMLARSGSGGFHPGPRGRRCGPARGVL